MQKTTIVRYLIYGLGTIILALGISLTTKAGLGVSPLISVPYSVAEIRHWNFAFLTFLLYVSYVAIEFILKGKKKEWIDLLQIPFSFVFSILLNVFDIAYRTLGVHPETLWLKLVLLFIAIIMVGVGVSMMVAMNLIPNPGDGLAKAVGDALHRNLGFGKNVIDIISVIITCCISFFAAGRLVGIGIGTVAAMICVGRCIALFNHFFRDKMLRAAGLIDPADPKAFTREKS